VLKIEGTLCTNVSSNIKPSPHPDNTDENVTDITSMKFKVAKPFCCFQVSVSLLMFMSVTFVIMLTENGALRVQLLLEVTIAD
jgi:hypothetical protein